MTKSIIPSSPWAALVYGRTYNTDFRFIVTPFDFTPDDNFWALNYIHTTTRSSEKLPGKPRLSLFRNEHHCVVGVTCIARELIGQGAEKISEDMTKDDKNRPLYIFLGYVAKVKSGHKLPPLPRYSQSNLSAFQPIYKYVIQKWKEKDYEVFSNKTLSQYVEHFDIIHLETEDTDSFQRESQELNFQDEQNIYLWPTSEHQNLWLAVSQSQQPISICLGLASTKDILNSKFLNGTTFDCHHKMIISRVTNSPQNISSPLQERTSLQSVSEEENFSQSLPSKDYRKVASNTQKIMLISLSVGIIVKQIVDLLTKENSLMDSNLNPEFDTDGDGIIIDTDGDGILDTVGIDTDGDGILDTVGIDNDGDGIVDTVGIDTDGDGTFEIAGVAVDLDGDGEKNGYLLEIDTDGDGIADKQDIAYHLDTNEDGVRDDFKLQSELDAD